MRHCTSRSPQRCSLLVPDPTTLVQTPGPLQYFMVAERLQAHAWFAGLHQPVVFNMHCNPSHYLLMHEGGHRLSFGHAETYLTDDGFLRPTDPLSTGHISSELPTGSRTYTDETDAMACCYGDYSVYAKLKVSPPEIGPCSHPS